MSSAATKPTSGISLIARLSCTAATRWLTRLRDSSDDRGLRATRRSPSRTTTRAWRSTEGLFVSLVEPSSRSITLLLTLCADLFWRDAEKNGFVECADASVLAFRVPRDGLRLPPLASWRPLAELSSWSLPEEEIETGESSLCVRLVESREPESLAGVLLASSELPHLDRALGDATDRERSEILVGRLGKAAWVFTPRGFPESVPLPGRALRVLQSRGRFVLLPRDREPRPAFDAAALLDIFGAESGQHLLWWDATTGERSVLFLRERLTPATSDELRRLAT